MASSVIHICIANEINKTINRDSKKLLIRTIAPDISKLLGETKFYSHFLDNVNNNIPNINKFLDNLLVSQINIRKRIYLVMLFLKTKVIFLFALTSFYLPHKLIDFVIQIITFLDKKFKDYWDLILKY